MITYLKDTPKGRIYSGSDPIEMLDFCVKMDGTFLSSDEAYEDFLKGIYWVII